MSGCSGLYYTSQHINYLQQKPRIDKIYATLQKDMPSVQSTDGMPEKYALNFYVNHYFDICKKYPLSRNDIRDTPESPIFGGSKQVLHPNYETYQKLVNDYKENCSHDNSFKKGAGCFVIMLASCAGIYFSKNKIT